MGHSSVSCILTGLPITPYRNHAALVPLLFNYNYRYREHMLVFDEGQSCMSSNDGERIMFNPLAFPIRGRYDGYGGIERIVADENTRLIERCCGMSVQAFCDAITSDDESSPDYMKKVHGAWLQGEIWDHFLDTARARPDRDYARHRYLDYFSHGGVAKERRTVSDSLCSCPGDWLHDYITEQARYYCLLPFEQKQLTEYYQEHVKENPAGRLAGTVAAFAGISTAMYAAGRFWMPSGNTFQDGELREYLRAHKKAVEIAERDWLEDMRRVRDDNREKRD